MSEYRKDEKGRPLEPIECGECDETLYPYEPMALYDGKWCHLHCAAHAHDNDDCGLF